jgi:plastocyanin
MKEVNVGDKVYFFTNRGLTKGVVVKKTLDKVSGKLQFKVNINKKHYNYTFSQNQFHKFYLGAILYELFKPLFRLVGIVK